MKEILAGTYWLIANGDSSRAICKGKKPKGIGKFGWTKNVYGLAHKL